MKRRYWTPDEDAILTRHYPTHTAQEVSAILTRKGYSRNPKSVGERARRLGVYTGHVKGYVPANWLIPTNGCALYKIVTEAERDGALRRTTGNAVKYLVTEAWADAYAEKQARHEEESRDAIGWLGYDEIGRLLNRDARDVAKGIAHQRGRLKKAFDGVESRVVTRARRRRRVFHPNQAREAVMRFRNSA